MKEDCIKMKEAKIFLGMNLGVMYKIKKCFISSLLDGCNEGYVRLYYGDEDDSEEVVELKDIRPLVRPLSDLTKEITVKGETFTPLIELAKICESDHFSKEEFIDSTVNSWGVSFFSKKNDEAMCFAYSLEQECFLIRSENNTKHFVVANTLSLYMKMAEWGLDIFNWLGRGLADKLED